MSMVDFWAVLYLVLLKENVEGFVRNHQILVFVINAEIVKK